MNKVLIRILKNWKNGETEYPVGQVLKVQEKSAERLVKEGFAEIYTPEEGDVVVPGTAPTKDASLTLDEIKKVVEDTIKANMESSVKRTVPDNDYFKTGGFKGFSHFAKDVAMACMRDARISPEMKTWGDKVSEYAKASGMSELIGADGGYLIPTQYRNQILQYVMAETGIAGRCMQIPMDSNTVKIPVVNESSRASTLFGGITVYRIGEGATYTASKPAIGRVTLNLKKVGALWYATQELLEDSPISMEPFLSGLFGQALRFQVEEDIINGVGGNQPLGILNAPCLVSTTRTTSTTIKTADVAEMWSRLLPQSQGNAVWLANPEVFPNLYQASVTVGSAGSVVGLIQFNGNGIAGAPSGTIMGRPLIITEHCQALGTAGDFILADFSQYLLGQKAGTTIAASSSIHLQFLYDETAYKMTMRYDGQPWPQSALTPKHGSDTLSPFVVVAA